jgi:hypothetical protein
MSDAEGGSTARCPWCSAELPAVLPADAATTCPSCGAALTSAAGNEPDIRGVTTLDHEAILRARSDASRSRGRLFSFITGDTTTSAPMKPEELASLAPPDTDVRREMLRLALEAERAELEAESLALRTEAVMERGLDLAADEQGAEPEESESPGAEGSPEGAETTVAGETAAAAETTAAEGTPDAGDTAPEAGRPGDATDPAASAKKAPGPEEPPSA